MALTPKIDYVYYPKADMSKQSLTAAMANGAVVCTTKLIAFLPRQAFGSLVVASVTTTWTKGGSDLPTVVEEMLADPSMTIEQLEANLKEILGGEKTRWLFPIAEAEKLSMKAGFFGMTSLKYPGESVRRLVIRTKGGKQEAKEFYDGIIGK